MANQKNLEKEVIGNLADIGVRVPASWDTIVTVMVMILVFYGVGAIKDLVTGGGDDGPSKRMLDGLLEELALSTGQTKREIREKLDARYSDKKLWERIANATSRIFKPSKNQDSAPIQVNDRHIDQETVRDVPAQYLLEHEAGKNPARDFANVTLELHAQDKDHSGKGWAAIPRGLTDKRLKLKLMENVEASEVWGHDVVSGDITVVYDRVGKELEAKAIHLHRVNGMDG